jgi:hypothetical protein
VTTRAINRQNIKPTTDKKNRIKDAKKMAFITLISNAPISPVIAGQQPLLPDSNATSAPVAKLCPSPSCSRFEFSRVP